MWSLVFGPHVATLPNLHKTSPLEREIETSLLCYSGSRKGKSVYLVVGSPWWLSSLTCSISWPSFSHSSDMFPSASISKHVALSSQECHTFFFSSTFWKGNGSRSGTCQALLSSLGWKATVPVPPGSGKNPAHRSFVWGRGFNPSDASTFPFKPCAQKPGQILLY